MENVIRMPKSELGATSSGMMMCEVFPSDDYTKAMYPWAKELIGRFPLPDFQRPLCWTQSQSISFIESAYLGFDLGSYMINNYEMKGGQCSNYSDVLIDGQQRINAVVEYINNEFRVFGAYWRELERADRTRFKHTTFTRKTVTCFDGEQLREAYNRLNFAGVRHTEDQRA